MNNSKAKKITMLAFPLIFCLHTLNVRYGNTGYGVSRSGMQNPIDIFMANSILKDTEVFFGHIHPFSIALAILYPHKVQLF